MKKTVFIILVLFGFCACKPKETEVEIQSGAFRMEEVCRGIYKILIRDNVNISVIEGENSLLVIDTGFRDTADSLKAFIERNFEGKPVKKVILTHFHGDHVGGLTAFSGAEVITNDFVAEKVEELQNFLPVVYVDTSGMSFADKKMELFNYRNTHTAKDLVVIFPDENIIVAADLLFADRFPFIDIQSGGNALTYVKMQRQLQAKLNGRSKIIGGHGRVYDKKEYEKLTDTLEKTVKVIGGLKARGLSLDEIKAQKPLEKYSDYSWNFINSERWVEIVYNSL